MNSKWRNKSPINFLASHKRKFIKVIITLLNLVHTVIPFTFFYWKRALETCNLWWAIKWVFSF